MLPNETLLLFSLFTGGNDERSNKELTFIREAWNEIAWLRLDLGFSHKFSGLLKLGLAIETYEH